MIVQPSSNRVNPVR